MKEKRLSELKKSYEEGFITKEEYENQKKEIENMQEENEEAREEENSQEVRETSLKSDKMLIIGAILLAILFAAVFGFQYFMQEKPKTIDDLHSLNYKGKLKEEQGYLYKDVYSFVKFEDLWYTQLQSPKGTRLYNIQFRYGPKEVESINSEGILDLQLFDNASDYYVTFTPHEGNNFSATVLAIGDWNEQMTKIFFKNPIAACDKNETRACTDVPIITCDNTDKLVLYIMESDNLKVIYDDNCITVQGSGFDLVKGVDRVLYGLYGIIE